MLGYSVEELLRIPLREIIGPQFRAQHDIYLKEIAQKAELSGLMAVMTRGGEHYIWSYHSTLRTEGVEVPIVRVTAHDVTEQKRIERLLRETSEDLLSKVRENEQTIRELKLFRTPVDQSSDAIEVVDPATLQFIDANEKACLDLGYSRQELLSLRVFDIDPAVTEASVAKIKEVLKKTGVIVIESLHRRKDGTIFPVEVSMGRVHLGRDYIISIARDLTERKQAEERIAASERQYRAVHERSPVGICWAETKTGRFLRVNSKYCEITGRTEEDLLNRNFQSITHPDDLAENLRKLERLRKREVLNYKVEKRYVRPDGSIRWVEVEIVAMAEGDAPPWHMAIVQDITERKRSEERLREYERVVEGLDEMIAVVDRDYRYIIANHAFVNYRGLKKEQVLGRRVDEVVNPEAFETIKQKLDECFQGKIVQYEMKYKYPDRGERVLSVSHFPIEGASGVDRIAAVLRDVTERKRGEEGLRAAKEFSENLIRTANMIILSLDMAGNVILFNQAAEEITGYTFAELKGKHWSILVPRDRFPDVWEEFDRVVAGTAGQTYENPVVTKTGEERYIAWRNNQVKVNGKVVATISFGNDITERRRAEEAIRESEARERAKSRELETVLETVPIPVFIAHDIECQHMTTNRAGYEQLRLPPGSNVSNTADPGERPSIRLLRDGKEVPREQLPMELAAATGGPVYGVPLTLAFEDGSERHTLVNAVPLLDADGRLTGVISASIDVTERKRAEDALQEREKTLRLILDHLAVGVILSSVGKEKALYQNPKFLELFGYSIEQYPSVAEWWPVAYPDPAYRKWVSEQWQQRMSEAAKNQGEIEPMEVMVTCHDGSRKYVRVLAKVIGDLNFITFVDLTEGKHAEEALRRSEENYRMFISQSSEGIFRQDMDAPVSINLPEDELVRHILHDSYLAECNDALARMYGLASGKEFVGRRLTEMVLPEDPHNIELTREYIRSAFRVLDRESHEIDIHGNPKVFLNSMIGTVENGMLVRTWGIQRDVTEKARLEESRRKAEEALRESEQRFRIALEGSPIKVFNQDRNLRYTWVYNPQEGWSEADYLGKTDDEIFGPEIGARMSAMKRPVLETGQPGRQEFSLTARGKTYHCDITIEPLRDAVGGVVGVNCACVDVTHLREITEELRQAKEKLAEEKIYLEQAIDSELGFGEIIGRSSALKEVMEKVARVAPSDATVLLLGETGTGKELVARALHRLSKRQGNSFIKLNCAAIPSGLLESELFGHEKGAFTGAVAKKVGRLELADQGTLFLDEIGEIPLELQPKLLRVLQDQEFERLGGTQTLKVNFRLLAATNRDLLQSVKQKDFRSDLYYRLNVFPIRLPALRERREDIRLLVEHFVRKYALRMNKAITSIPAKTMEALVQWEWPGNIRELENLVERSVILSSGTVLQAPLSELHGVAEEVHGVTLRDKERERILRALRECHGQIGGPNGAAARLGLKRTTLQSKMSQLGIKYSG
jgi:PAS domain S-box-containing protein